MGSINGILIKQLDRKRFNALAGLTRSPAAACIGEELAWYANEEETIIGVLLRDIIDNDYAAVVLARDEGGRFRAFDQEASLESEESARGWLERVIKWHTGLGLKMYPQGHPERGPDLFTPIVPPARLHPDFVHVANDSAYFPARNVITKIMPYFIDIDGNFVQQFQSDGFDARLWELYLYAYLAEEELFLDRTHSAPDFLVCRAGETVAIEAVIVGRKQDTPQTYFKTLPTMKAPEEIKVATENEIPIRFGSPLYSKLKKTYWELPHAKGKPLVFAIADFHDDQSMLWTSSALISYLYGIRQEFEHDAKGQLEISSTTIKKHKVKDKEIPSGFFFQPDAQHVSAVLSSACGTISKFNRIGRQAGFHDKNHIMIRFGTCHNHNPNAVVPNRFRYEVNETCNETWAEGLSMYHNPKAEHPVPERLFPSIAHHHFSNGQI